MRGENVRNHTQKNPTHLLWEIYVQFDHLKVLKCEFMSSLIFIAIFSTTAQLLMWYCLNGRWNWNNELFKNNWLEIIIMAITISTIRQRIKRVYPSHKWLFQQIRPEHCLEISKNKWMQEMKNNYWQKARWLLY